MEYNDYNKLLLKNKELCDIIQLDEVLDILNMKKRIQQAHELHPYEIHYTEKSGYFTEVDDASRPNGKKKIRRSSEESLWNALADWYLDNNTNITFKELYEKWLNWKRTPNNDENIKRIQASWKAYYLDEPLSRDLLRKSVARITTLDLRSWAEALMKKHLPDKKKFSRMFTIVNQCFEYASDEDIAIVPENIWQKARKKLNKSLLTSVPTASDESQVFTDEERRQLKIMVREDLERYKKQSSSAGLQILFLLETGLRIGECCGLKWSDIKNNRLYISRQATNEKIKNKTKTASSCRDIPLTKEAQRILEEVAAFNKEHNFTADWIFQSDNPKYDYRLSYNAADRKLRKLCSRMDTIAKSPHKCRKTCISTLLDNPNVNNRTVQRFAGHHDLSTTYNYYNFERKSKEEQAEAIDLALSL
jgi:integrase